MNEKEHKQTARRSRRLENASHKAWSLALLVCVLVAGCGRRPQEAPAPPTERIYDGRGVVREIDLKEKNVVIQHETIPGYMEAMTMPFNVKDTNVLAGIAPDDAIKFQLVVTETDAWISTLTKMGSVNKPASEAPTDQPAAGVTNEVASLKGGDEVPDFTLVDQDGKPVHLSDYRGKAVVLTFIFTRCPLPNFCPLMSRNFAALQTELGKEFADRFHLVSISFDPEHDTPLVLKDYGSNFGQNPKVWSFTTGTPEQIKALANQFGLTYQPEAGSISHTMRTALIDPHGRLVHIWKSNVWQPLEVETMVREIMPRL